MKLTSKQEKVIALTMELDLMAKEYKILCDRLEIVKNDGKLHSTEYLLELKDKFLQNQKEIKRINEELKKLQDEK